MRFYLDNSIKLSCISLPSASKKLFHFNRLFSVKSAIILSLKTVEITFRLPLNS